MFFFRDEGVDFIESYMTRWTYRCAGTAGHADIGLHVKWCVHFHFHATSSQADGAVSHLFTHAHTQAAEDAVVIFCFKARFIDTILLGKTF